VEEERVRQKPREFRLHTLGPTGTNCEAAARYWLEQRGYRADGVVLHETLETAVNGVLAEPRDCALLGCVVYPQLHEIIFQNLGTMSLRECFVMPTHRMVLAGDLSREVTTVLSHAAPASLLDGLGVQIKMAKSNADAALGCVRGEADACITTIVAAQANELTVIKDFGAVSMGFSIHAPHGVHI
jgi:prephenate dehydratase